MEKIIGGIIGSLFVAFVGHYFGENTALAVIGGWVFLGLLNK